MDVDQEFEFELIGLEEFLGIRENKIVVEEKIKELTIRVQDTAASFTTSCMTELRSFRNPPAAVTDVIHALQLALGRESESVHWKKFISVENWFWADWKFRQLHLQMSKGQREKIQALIARHDGLENMEKVSAAAAPLSKWLGVRLKYAELNEELDEYKFQIDQLKNVIDKSTIDTA